MTGVFSPDRIVLNSYKFRSTRLSGFSGVKAYMLYGEALKNHCNAVGRTFCDAIKIDCRWVVLGGIKKFACEPQVYPLWFFIFLKKDLLHL
jgi:hypothetical protein